MVKKRKSVKKVPDKKQFSYKKALIYSLSAAACVGLSVFGKPTYVYTKALGQVYKEKIAFMETHVQEYGSLDSLKFLANEENSLALPSVEEEIENDALTRYISEQEDALKLQSIELEKKILDYGERLPELRQEHEQRLKEIETGMQQEKGSNSASAWLYYKRFLDHESKTNWSNDPLLKLDNYEFAKEDLNKIAGNLSGEILTIDFDISSRNAKSKNNGKESATQDFSKYKEFIPFCNNIFEKVTGKNIPKSAKVNIVKEIKDKRNKDDFMVLGNYSFLDNQINLVDKGFINNIFAYSHELGHLCYQGQEELVYGVLKSSGRFTFLHKVGKINNKECSVLEEAAAYIFATIMADEIKKTYPEDLKLEDNLNTRIMQDRHNFFTDYLDGKDEEHACGWAMAEALASHFNKDYAKAFNCLCRVNAFSQLPQEVVKNYKMFKENIKTIDERIETAKKQRLDSLISMKQKVEELSNHYSD